MRYDKKVPDPEAKRKLRRKDHSRVQGELRSFVSTIKN